MASTLNTDYSSNLRLICVATGVRYDDLEGAGPSEKFQNLIDRLSNVLPLIFNTANSLSSDTKKLREAMHLQLNAKEANSEASQKGASCSTAIAKAFAVLPQSAISVATAIVEDRKTTSERLHKQVNDFAHITKQYLRHLKSSDSDFEERNTPAYQERRKDTFANLQQRICGFLEQFKKLGIEMNLDCKLQLLDLVDHIWDLEEKIGVLNSIFAVGVISPNDIPIEEYHGECSYTCCEVEEIFQRRNVLSICLSIHGLKLKVLDCLFSNGLSTTAPQVTQMLKSLSFREPGYHYPLIRELLYRNVAVDEATKKFLIFRNPEIRNLFSVRELVSIPHILGLHGRNSFYNECLDNEGRILGH